MTPFSRSRAADDRRAKSGMMDIDTAARRTPSHRGSVALALIVYARSMRSKNVRA